MVENSKFDKKSIKTVLGKTANFGELAKDCVAFANANGGVLYIGIEDDSDLPESSQRICEDLPEKIVKRINELTFNVAVRPEIVTVDNGGQYIKLQIFPSQVSIASTTKGQFLFRNHDKSRPLLPDELSRLISDKPSYNWETNPDFVAQSKVQFPTTLKTIEPYRLKALIKEDLRFYPDSLLAEIAQRLPDVEFHELQRMTREMAKSRELKTSGGRRYRRYSLP